MSRSDTVHQGYDIFVGFLYATTVGLIIRSAVSLNVYTGSVATIFLFLIVLFLAYDWIVRFKARLQLPEGGVEESGASHIIKFFVEIAIIFVFLPILTFILEYAIYHSIDIQIGAFIQNIRKSLSWEGLWSRITHAVAGVDFITVKGKYTTFCCFVAIYAILSQCWNYVFVTVSKQVTGVQVIAFLTCAHIRKDLLVLFPSTYAKVKSHRREAMKLRLESEDRTHKFLYDFENWLNNREDEGFWKIVRFAYCILIRVKTSMRKLVSAAKFSTLNARFLITPYFNFYHLFVFYIMIAGLLALKLLHELYMVDNIITNYVFFPTPEDFGARILLSLVFVLTSVLFMAFHFMNSIKPSICEKISGGSLLLAVFLFYSAFSTLALVVIVFLQQFLANIYMQREFHPGNDIAVRYKRNLEWRLGNVRN